MNLEASSSSNSFDYHVFLNFRGEDTRHGFTGNLYKALCRGGIHTFMDDEELKKGDQIETTLLKKIRESRMAITILSENYASSTFCLTELVEILQCIKEKGRLVYPIFYGVNPSDVRHQTGKYKEALDKHLKDLKANKEKMQIWKSALREVANLSGLHFNPKGHEYEHTIIAKIVKEISTKIDRATLLYKADYVGLDKRVQEVNSLLGDNASNDTINMVGICGIGGIGKTTIARAVYDSIADHFEGFCFLNDIKGNSSELGLQKLQESMLSEILGLDIKVNDVNKGISTIKTRLNQKKILLVLDNVDNAKQLEKLAGNCNWFGPGSRILITTRDKHLLKSHGIKIIYEVEELNNEESQQLLCWKAFKNNQVDSSYNEVLNCVVQYAKGLPLALEVLGSLLFGKTINEWKSALYMYRKIPNKDIQQILKLSYDSLHESVKELFLDIACFFKGNKLEYVRHAHGSDPSYGLGVLVDNCLIKIEHSYIIMHDLIQDMGREIVRQESANKPGERSRLWFHEDILHVLQNNEGTDKIRGIVLNNPFEVTKVSWDGKAFEKMKSLKILIIENARFSKVPEYLPNNLRVLKWHDCPASCLHNYPASCLPNNFQPTGLGILDLQKNSLRSLPFTRMDSMTVLKLDRCQFITQIPDVSGLPNLKELNLDNCGKLFKVHHSVGYLGKLEILSVEDCVRLRTFPREIRLPFLQYLGFKGCVRLKKFPEILEKMENIFDLDLSETNFELPYSIHNLTNLEEVVMKDCKRILLPRSITLLTNLRLIYADGCGELGLSKQNEGQEGVSSIQYLSERNVSLMSCGLSDEVLPIYLSYFSNVHTLNLSESSFTILPVCIKEFRFLKCLYLDNCTRLREIRGIPPNIEVIGATDCTSLSWESRRILLHQELLERTEFKTLSMPGRRIPEWFDHYYRGPYISFWFRAKLPLISVCHIKSYDYFHYCYIDPMYEYNIRHVLEINGRRLRENHISEFHTVPRTTQMYVIGQLWKDDFENQVFRDSEWNLVKIYSEFLWEWDMKKMGIYVDKKASNMEDIKFTNPYKRPKSNDVGSEQSGATIHQAKVDEHFAPKRKLYFDTGEVTEEGRIVDMTEAQRFVQLMQTHTNNRECDLGGQIMLVNVKGATNGFHYAKYSVYLKGFPVLDKLFEKGIYLEDSVVTDDFGCLKQPLVSLRELRTYGVEKSMNRLPKHKHYEIRKKIKGLVYIWLRSMSIHLSGPTSPPRHLEGSSEPLSTSEDENETETEAEAEAKLKRKRKLKELYDRPKRKARNPLVEVRKKARHWQIKRKEANMEDKGPILFISQKISSMKLTCILLLVTATMLYIFMSGARTP